MLIVRLGSMPECVIRVPDDDSSVTNTVNWLRQQTTEVQLIVLHNGRLVYEEINKVSKEQAGTVQGCKQKDENIRHLQDELEKLRSEVDDRVARANEQQLVLNMQIKKEEIEENSRYLSKMYESQISELMNRNARLESRLDETYGWQKEEKQTIAAVLAESTSIIKQFTKESKSGDLGERLVESVFLSQINIGELEKTTHSNDQPGMEDFLWCLENTRANVEVKWKNAIHSKHDIEKHKNRTYEAARLNKIDFALFLSLRCKIPNKKIVDCEYISGVPVIYCGVDDEITPQNAIIMAFRLGLILSHILCATKASQQASKQNSLVVHQVCSRVTQINGQVILVEKQITLMKRTVNQLYKQLESMESIKKSLLLMLEAIRSDFPDFFKEEQENL